MTLKVLEIFVKYFNKNLIFIVINLLREPLWLLIYKD